MATKTKRMISPICIAAYAWLENPDEGQEYSDGKYKVTLLLDKKDKDVKAFLKKLEALSDEIANEKFGEVPKEIRYCYKDGDLKDKEDFAGKWMLVAKTKFRPGMVDCADPPATLDEGKEPASGDLVRASFALIGYEAAGIKGVAAQLRNVQLFEKRNLGAKDFDSIDGGYTSVPAEDDEF